MRSGKGWIEWDLAFVGLLLVLFTVWLLYRLIIRRDLMQHLDELRTMAFFLAVMVLVYWWLFL